MSFLKLLAPFQQLATYCHRLTALLWLWGSGCSPTSLSESQERVNLKPASKIQMLNFAESSGLRSDQPLHGGSVSKTHAGSGWAPANLSMQAHTEEVSQGLEIKPRLWLGHWEGESMQPRPDRWLHSPSALSGIPAELHPCVFIEVLQWPLLQCLDLMEKRKMWL